MEPTNTFEPKPGDYYLTATHGLSEWLIRIGQLLTQDASRYNHAGLYLGDGLIIEAQQGGAKIRPFPYLNKKRFPKAQIAYTKNDLTDEERQRIVDAAKKYENVQYSWAVYLGLALVTFWVRPKWLLNYIKSSNKMICSQLVDQAYLDAGIHLFDDGRYPGDVTPGDLAHIGTLYHIDTGPYRD